MKRLFERAIVLGGAALVVAEPLLVSAAARLWNWWRMHLPFCLRGGAYAGIAQTLLPLGGGTGQFVQFDF